MRHWFTLYADKIKNYSEADVEPEEVEDQTDLHCCSGALRYTITILACD